MESPTDYASFSSQGQQTTTGQAERPMTDHLTSNHVVVFADMLGFAALTEANPIDLRMLQARCRPLSLTFDEIVSKPKNPLTETFSGFHHSLSSAIELAGMQHALTAITFSDSVFIATKHFFEAAGIAVNLAHSMLSQKIPVRMGIAFGSFAAVKFRSDVSGDGGDHAAQFLGTAVVRAYQTERCGIKGMRILLHPSVVSLLVDSAHNPATPPVGGRPTRLQECSDTERMNKIGVRYELDYWNLATTKEGSAWRGLQDMWAAAPDSAVDHYKATAEAINRMRMAQGEAPITNLRRRTLPHCRG
jgi:hypothetical protein